MNNMTKIDYVSLNAETWDNINECLIDKTTDIFGVTH